ncbi:MULTISPECIES: hypothetical protein [Streptomyces]|uniref:Lipoprotein n=1 Tax=Streptomyces virginiae TaxID=1961 RepID=A0ABZ1TN49_STRVG|nr:hypothetical protein [Streptomyces virginiae]WTB26969.1 hypothetical protein OG253_38915 [Streptomyces virginiae]
MKLRHVRAVAVFGIAIFALTGARGSHGGSCGGSSHSSGSGSSGSSSSTGGSDSTSGSTGTTGSSTGSPSVTGGSGNNKAERDIKIDACKMDASGKNLVAKITVTNSGSVDYTYNISMKFRGDTTSAATPAQAKVSALTVKAGASKQAEATAAYTGKGDGSEYKECVVDNASKSAL